MPRFPKPWYRKDRRRWFVQIDGKQVNLGPDREAAFRRYHELMNRPKQPAFVPAETVLAVIDAFLDWTEKNRAEATYVWYRDRLQLFARFIPVDLRVSELKPFHLQQWLDSEPGWSDGSKRNGARAVQRTMNWAEEQGIIDRSPVAHFKKPQQGKRETVISPEEFETILGLVPDRGLRDLLIVAWETGARPQEMLAVEARHVDVRNTRWVFPPAESKVKAFPRIVYLSERAVHITKRLMLAHPEGPLFRNTRGEPWTTESVNCAFIRIHHRQGKAVLKERGLEVPEEEIANFIKSLKPTRIEKGKTVTKSPAELRCEAKRKLQNRLATEQAQKYCLYVLRHSFATRGLQNGVDPLTMAILLGHADPSMLAKTYQHLSVNPDYLLGAARRASA